MINGYSDKMVRNTEYGDKVLECVEKGCKNKTFVWTGSEQKYFANKVIKDESTGKMRPLAQPKRCPECREKRRLQFNQK